MTSTMTLSDIIDGKFTKKKMTIDDLVIGTCAYDAIVKKITYSKQNQKEHVNSSCRKAKDLGIDLSNRIQQIKVEEPPKRKAGIKVANVAELVSKLKNEAKVL